jgi:hypothetical protein
MTRRSIALALFLGGLVTGCGKHYWESRTPERGFVAFTQNSEHCIAEAKTAKYGIGAEEIYRACMKAHGWRRVQTPSPTHEQFRGPEDIDEFSSPPYPLSERGVGPSRASDPACLGPTASRPQHCPRR